MRSTYLCHHGIKGMKWGVRRYQNEDGTYTPEGRERYGVGSKIYGVKSKNAPKSHANHVGYVDHPDIKKGTTLYRISSKSNDLGNKRLYTTYDEKDRLFYLSGGWNPDKSKVLYEQYLEPVKDLKVAQIGVVSKEATKLYGNDPLKVSKAFINAFAKTKMANMPVEMIDAYEKWDGTEESIKGIKVKDMTSSDVHAYLGQVLPAPKKEMIENRKRFYEAFNEQMMLDAASATNTDSKKASQLTKRLTSMGYDAQVDVGGVGALVKRRNITTGRSANDPLIIFNSDKVLRQKADSIAISPKVKAEAERLYMEYQSKDATDLMNIPPILVRLLDDQVYSNERQIERRLRN